MKIPQSVRDLLVLLESDQFIILVRIPALRIGVVIVKEERHEFDQYSRKDRHSG
jgi:hypothetical protein